MANISESGGEISIKVRPRQFIEDISLPLLSRARTYDPAHKPRGLKRLNRKLAQAADHIVHGWMNVPARGSLTVRKFDGLLGTYQFDAHQSAYLAFASRAFHGGYEPVETMFLEAMLARCSVFHDVGANWGYYSLLAATHPGFKGKVYSFDVSAQMNADLSRLAEALAMERMEVMGYGLSNRSGTVLTSGDQATHLTKIIDPSDRGTERSASARVERLDDIALPPPELMKIDVEDHEHEVFEGGRRTLEEHHPLILFECRDFDASSDAIGVLRSCGYSVYGLSQHTSEHSVLCLHPIDSDTSFPMSGHANLVAVKSGDEIRWFG
jgi:FkbM family methyltransferase